MARCCCTDATGVRPQWRRRGSSLWTLLCAVPPGTLLLLVPGVAAQPPPTCEPWCSEPCTALNGNVQIECGLCEAGSSRCHPGAEGYETWLERNQAFQKSAPPMDRNHAAGGRQQPVRHPAVEAAMNLAPGCDTLRCKRVREKRLTAALEQERREKQQAQEQQRKLPATPPPPPPPQPRRRPPPLPTPTPTRSKQRVPGLGPRHDGRTAGGVEVRCELQRITGDEVRQLTPSERVSLFEYPTIVTELVGDWAAMQSGGWASPRNFTRRFGHHRIMAKRTAFGIDRSNKLGVELETASIGLVCAVCGSNPGL